MEAPIRLKLLLVFLEGLRDEDIITHGWHGLMQAVVLGRAALNALLLPTVQCVSHSVLMHEYVGSDLLG